MKNRIKNLFVIPVIALLAFSAISGSAFAFMKSKSPVLENDLLPAAVSCEISETFENNTKTSITVENTGNMDAYIRVRIVSCWLDEEGRITAEPSKEVSFTLAENWLGGSGDTYYYADKIAPGGKAELLGGSIELSAKEGKRQVIEVFAEAVQALPAKAAENAWGVTVADGKITAAP